MQFLVTLSPDQLTDSPAELQSAMTEFVENELKAGTFVITGGLASHADGSRVELPPGGLLQREPPAGPRFRCCRGALAGAGG